MEKKIVIAVDDSRHSNVNITFFHVTPKLKDFCAVDFEEIQTEALEEIIRKGDKECIDQFFSHAKKRLNEAGIQESQINFKVGEGLFRVGKAVLDEFQRGDFGTLVVGRRGMNKKFFTGSVSGYLMNGFSEGALWVVPESLGKRLQGIHPS